MPVCFAFQAAAGLAATLLVAGLLSSTAQAQHIDPVDDAFDAKVCEPVLQPDLLRRLPRAVTFDNDGEPALALWAVDRDGLATRRYSYRNDWANAWFRLNGANRGLPGTATLPLPQTLNQLWSRSLPVAAFSYPAAVRAPFGGVATAELPLFFASFGFLNPAQRSTVGLPLLRIELNGVSLQPYADPAWASQAINHNDDNFKHSTAVQDRPRGSMRQAHFFGIPDNNADDLYRIAVNWDSTSRWPNDVHVDFSNYRVPPGGSYSGVDPGPNSAVSMSLDGTENHLVFVRAVEPGETNAGVEYLHYDGMSWDWSGDSLGQPVANADIVGEPLVLRRYRASDDTHRLDVYVVARNPLEQLGYNLYGKHFKIAAGQPLAQLHPTTWVNYGSPGQLQAGREFRLTASLDWLENGNRQTLLFGYTEEANGHKRLLQFYPPGGFWTLRDAPDGSNRILTESTTVYHDSGYRRLSVFTRSGSGAIHELFFEIENDEYLPHGWRWRDLSCTDKWVINGW